jgi:hypothetical protein
LDWREGDMANNLTVLFSHQENGQSASLPQGINNGSLCPVTMWSTVERGGDEHSDFFDVLGIFWSYNHENCVANPHCIAKTKQLSQLWGRCYDG